MVLHWVLLGTAHPIMYMGRHLWGLRLLMLGTLFHSHMPSPMQIKCHLIKKALSNYSSHTTITLYPFSFPASFSSSFFLTFITIGHITSHYLFFFLESKIPLQWKQFLLIDVSPVTRWCLIYSRCSKILNEHIIKCLK